MKEALWEGARVKGAVMPLTLKPEPEAAICEMVTLAPPALVMVEDRELELPTVTLPKLRFGGVAVNRPGVTAVPDRAREREELEALEVTMTLPVTLPAD